MRVVVNGLVRVRCSSLHTCVHCSGHCGWCHQNFGSVSLTEGPRAACWPTLGQSQGQGRGVSLLRLSLGLSSLSEAPLSPKCPLLNVDLRMSLPFRLPHGYSKGSGHTLNCSNQRAYGGLQKLGCLHPQVDSAANWTPQHCPSQGL